MRIVCVILLFRSFLSNLYLWVNNCYSFFVTSQYPIFLCDMKSIFIIAFASFLQSSHLFFSIILSLLGWPCVNFVCNQSFSVGGADKRCSGSLYFCGFLWHDSKTNIFGLLIPQFTSHSKPQKYKEPEHLLSAPPTLKDWLQTKLTHGQPSRDKMIEKNKWLDCRKEANAIMNIDFISQRNIGYWLVTKNE